MLALLIQLAFSQIIGLSFLAAGILKARDPRGTLRSVEAYSLLPTSTANVFSLLLPWVELLIAGSLITEIAFRFGIIGAIILLVVFSAAQMVALVKGQDIPCGCFGSALDERLTWKHVCGNGVLLVTGCVVAAVEFLNQPSPESVPFTLLDIFAVRMCASLAFVHFLTASQIVENQVLRTRILAAASKGSSA